MGWREQYVAWKERAGRVCKECGKAIRPDSFYCQKHAYVGERNHNWRGGRFAHRGYVYVLMPDNPGANLNGYVLEHRATMEAHIGRTLLPTEIVHHIDGNTGNNLVENLMLFSGHSEHHLKAHPHKTRGNYGYVYSTHPEAVRIRERRDKKRREKNNV
jgi:hypothetical protein